MQLIALHGQAGAGKDSFADRLVDRHDFVKRGFADPLYEEAAAAFGVTVAWMRDRARKEIPQPELALWNCKDQDFKIAMFNAGEIAEMAPRSPRWILEHWGTDYRRSQSDTYWLDQMADFYYNRAPRAAAGLVINDCRFLNEGHWVCRNLGRVFRIVRPGLADVSKHVSTIPLPDYLVERTIHNAGSLSYLHAVADFASRQHARTA